MNAVIYSITTYQRPQSGHPHQHTRTDERDRRPYILRCLPAAQVCCGQIKMVGGKKQREEGSYNITQDDHMWSTAPAWENVRHLCLSLSYASIFSQSEKCSLQFGCSLSFECLPRGQNGVIWSALTLKTSCTQTCGREARLCYSQGLSHVISLPFISTPARRSVI